MGRRALTPTSFALDRTTLGGRATAAAEAATNDNAPSERLPQLDGLRGVAAAVVVLHHVLLAVPYGLAAGDEAGPFAAILVLGRPMVVLFFVLSGFVLTLQLTGKSEGLPAYAVRRFVRLLPPYWAALGGAWLLHRLTHGSISALSPWAEELWGGPVSPIVVARHLAMLAGPGPHQFPLDHVAWSLVHELRLSLILPFLVLVATRLSIATALLVGAAVTFAAEAAVVARPDLFPAGLHGFRFDAPGLGPSIVLTVRFAVDLALGAVLALRRRKLRDLLARWAWAGPVALVMALALLSQRDETLMALGAAGLIAAAVALPWYARLLNAGPVAWLGRVSFSLYLVHLPVLFACGAALGDRVPLPIIVAAGVALSLLSAELLCRLVEEPSIHWSRAAGRTVARWADRCSTPADQAGWALLERWKEITSPRMRSPILVRACNGRWREQGLRLGGAALCLAMGIVVGGQFSQPIVGGLRPAALNRTGLGASGATAISENLLPHSWANVAGIAHPIQNTPPVATAAPTWTGALSIPVRDGGALPQGGSVPAPTTTEAEVAGHGRGPVAEPNPTVGAPPRGRIVDAAAPPIAGQTKPIRSKGRSTVPERPMLPTQR